MEGVALDQFKKWKPFTIPMGKFNSHLSDESDQDASATATNLHIIIKLIRKKNDRSIIDNNVG